MARQQIFMGSIGTVPLSWVRATPELHICVESRTIPQKTLVWETPATAEIQTAHALERLVYVTKVH
jgi:hypothetical protein